MNDCAKYQHPKKKFLYFFEKFQNCIFYIFQGAKQNGPFKEEKKFKKISDVLDPIDD